MRTLLAFAAIAALAACGQQSTTATTETPDATTASIEGAAPAQSGAALSEADARSRVETAGYTDITGLTQNPDGSWNATATRDGAALSVVIDGQGNVSVAGPA